MDASEQSVFSKVLDKWLQIRLSSYRISLYLVKEAGKWYVDPESIMNYDMMLGSKGRTDRFPRRIEGQQTRFSCDARENDTGTPDKELLQSIA